MRLGYHQPLNHLGRRRPDRCHSNCHLSSESLYRPSIERKYHKWANHIISSGIQSQAIDDQFKDQTEQKERKKTENLLNTLPCFESKCCDVHSSSSPLWCRSMKSDSWCCEFLWPTWQRRDVPCSLPSPDCPLLSSFHSSRSWTTQSEPYRHRWPPVASLRFVWPFRRHLLRPKLHAPTVERWLKCSNVS